MIALVTGAAGFIGSHLSEHLLENGTRVRGVDCLTGYYDPSLKVANLDRVLGRPGFELCQVDLADADLRGLLDGVDVVYHLAGQPGVRPSWGREFADYVRHNIVATQALLEAVRERPVRKLVYASSSSVYGNAEGFPTSELARPEPVSPYGMTKLAGEHLCMLYHVNFGLPVVCLRLFTVYGPRQRPDMAFRRLVNAALTGSCFQLFGDGEQTRDFTYVGDVVGAFHAAALSPWSGVANIGGGSRTSMNALIAELETLVGPIDVRRSGTQLGDVQDTSADTSLAARHLGYAPRTNLREGLKAMVDWASTAVLLKA